ncbi:uncharacterized protein BO72DRAFT_174734 [Aspergillus fijiensis CBS 313.89]|uniref:Uncharacterized protein n=1 Tax=Aspergillus fijiensis CBS 313.89 TaxID=1448319 RepID=A0A8G1VWM9_9EURO|nr:uncharacterized protein BO72DRAFT_174734 [Aspergillus fijiensis CBS 313.89]RAK75362.1 hypothetical protein BO72DRAFT_174734 [Aspergillus fijiensis CBS 313.89]
MRRRGQVTGWLMVACFVYSCSSPPFALLLTPCTSYSFAIYQSMDYPSRWLDACIMQQFSEGFLRLPYQAMTSFVHAVQDYFWSLVWLFTPHPTQWFEIPNLDAAIAT